MKYQGQVYISLAGNEVLSDKRALELPIERQRRPKELKSRRYLGGHLTPRRLTTQCTWERNSWVPADTLRILKNTLCERKTLSWNQNIKNVWDKHFPQNVCFWVEQEKPGHVRAFLTDGYFPFHIVSV